MRPSTLPLIVSTFLLVTLGGCSRKDKAETPTPQAPAPVNQAQAPAAQASLPFTMGTVVETMDASTYTYLRVKTSTGDIWAAANKCNVKVGDQVAVPTEAAMENFHSPSLNRTFPTLYMTSRVFLKGDQDFPAQNK